MPAFDLTDADAQGLDALAAAQLRLALRFGERAEAAEDDDAACKLARTSERAARSYRQILLVKSKLRRERDAALENADSKRPPPGPQEQARINRRYRDLYEAVERIVVEAHADDEETAEFVLDMVRSALDDMIEEPGFADADLGLQIDRVRAEVGFNDEFGPQSFRHDGADTPREPADSS